MKIIISLILSLIFIIPTYAHEKNDHLSFFNLQSLRPVDEVTPYTSPEELEEILSNLAEGVECQIANQSLKADLQIYKSFNSIFNYSSPDILSQVETKIALNEELFAYFVVGVIRIIEVRKMQTEVETAEFLAFARQASAAKVNDRKRGYYDAGTLDQHYSETLKYIAKCRRWSKNIMGEYAPN